MSLFINEVVEENAKLKKAIEILKRELKFAFADETQKVIIDDSISWDMLNISLNKEDYNLLKEVFDVE